ncbi:MAG: hypothetical protein VZS44_08345 [Bacilli bacterium]|nr:hypothetical protein [Bacilli bacterium]
MKMKIKNGDDYIEVDSEFPDNKIDYNYDVDNENDLDKTKELLIISDKDE